MKQLKKLLILFSLFIISTGVVKGVELKSSISYNGININTGNSLKGENWYISNVKGVNNETDYFSVILKNNQMVEINDEMYYLINYSGQYDSDRINKENSFVKINGNIKLAKYISSNLFLNFYLETDYKNYLASESGEYMAVAPKVEIKLPKNSITLSVKGDCKYFLNKVKQERVSKEYIYNVYGELEQEITTTESPIYTRRVDKGVEVTLSKEITETIYAEIFTSYGETNNNTKYGERQDTKIEVPDIANEGMSVSYGYIGWTPYNGNIGVLTLYGMYEKDIYIEENIELKSVISGFAYSKGGIKILGEIGVNGSYEFIDGGYSLSTYIKKAF